jgi:hypothetical protein
MGDPEIYERLATLEAKQQAQHELLTEVRDDIKLLLGFRAGLTAVSAVVSLIVGSIVAFLFKKAGS